MMMVNTSGTCATTRLIQCRNFGVSMNDVSRKFDQDPEDVPDLSKEEFIARRQILDQVEEWSSTLGKHGEFAPILYRYEVGSSMYYHYVGRSSVAHHGWPPRSSRHLLSVR